jgi:hypothetical protein
MRAASASLLLISMFAATAEAQQSPSPVQTQSAQQPAEKTPQIKLNFLNVCTPPEAEQKEIAAALDKIPAKVTYSGDFEVTRGRTISEKEGPSKYVRLRRELSNNALFNNVQYSLSADAKNTTETLVFKTKEPKDLVLISIEDQISAGAVKPASVLDADTPASHIKLERFGKASIALARCENADQSAYEPLFAKATKLIADYRQALGLRSMFRSDLTWLSAADDSSEKSAKSSKSKKTAADETKPAGKHLN